MDPKPRRGGNNLIRLLAFLALLVSLVVVAVVISSSLDGGDEEPEEKKDPEIAGCRPDADYENVAEGYYVVQPEDQFVVIEERTCVPVEELQRLNPAADEQALIPGTCLKLELGGCQNRES